MEHHVENVDPPSGAADEGGVVPVAFAAFPFAVSEVGQAWRRIQRQVPGVTGRWQY